MILSTLVVGIAKMGMRGHSAGFLQDVVLFICASFISITLGLVIVNLLKPGAGINFVAPADTVVDNVATAAFFGEKTLSPI